MRFAVAEHQLVDEPRADHVVDGYPHDPTFDAREQVALAFTDAFLGRAGDIAPEVVAGMVGHFDEAERVELAGGLALFHGFSKMLILLGLEPEQMPTTMRPVPR